MRMMCYQNFFIKLTFFLVLFYLTTYSTQCVAIEESPTSSQMPLLTNADLTPYAPEVPIFKNNNLFQDSKSQSEADTVGRYGVSEPIMHDMIKEEPSPDFPDLPSNAEQVDVPDTPEDLNANIQGRVYFAFNKNAFKDPKNTLEAQTGWLEPYPAAKAILDIDQTMKEPK